MSKIGFPSRLQVCILNGRHHFLKCIANLSKSGLSCKGLTVKQEFIKRNQSWCKNHLEQFLLLSHIVNSVQAPSFKIKRILIYENLRSMIERLLLSKFLLILLSYNLNRRKLHYCWLSIRYRLIFYIV